jgi:integrase
MLAEELGAPEDERYSNSAIRRHVMVLSLIMAAAKLDNLIPRNPCDGIKLPAENPRPMRFLTADEVELLVEVAFPHYRPLIKTAPYLGLRFGELAGLAPSHVDLLRRRVRVERQLVEASGEPLHFGPPKTKASSRTVTIPDPIVDVLAKQLGSDVVRRSASASGLGSLVFPTSTGRPMRRGSFRQSWRTATSRADETWWRELEGDDRPERSPFDALVFHELRHTCAALSLAVEPNLLAVKERLGHDSISTTVDLYGHLVTGTDDRIAEGLGELLRDAEERRRRRTGASADRDRQVLASLAVSGEEP